MKVLSLFDGMSCGRIALERAGIQVTEYYASEVDKYAIKVSKANYPDIIQIGDVTKVSYKDGTLFTENGEFNVGKIDLLIGGSPCQSFSSFAFETRTGFDGKSKLFFEWFRLFKEVNPTYFLLENVRMKQEWKNQIDLLLNTNGVLINSSLVSAQNRPRLYWSNLDTSQPSNKHIVLDQIFDKSADQKYVLSNKAKKYIASNNRLVDRFVRLNGEKAKCLLAVYALNGTFWCIDAQGNLLDKKAEEFLTLFQRDVIYNDHDHFAYLNSLILRKLSPIEYERLQTVPDNYTSAVSDAQRYKMIGNGWTVDIIAHIFKGLRTETEVE